MLFNWEADAVLFFSNEPIESRLHYIHAEYLNWESYILYPIISTILFLTFSEYIMWFLEWLTIKGVEARDTIKHAKQIKQSMRNTELNKQKLTEQESLEDYKERKELNEKIKNLESDLEKQTALHKEIELEHKRTDHKLREVEDDNRDLKQEKNALNITLADAKSVIDDYQAHIEAMEVENRKLNPVRYEDNDLYEAAIEMFPELKNVESQVIFMLFVHADGNSHWKRSSSFKTLLNLDLMVKYDS